MTLNNSSLTSKVCASDSSATGSVILFKNYDKCKLKRKPTQLIKNVKNRHDLRKVLFKILAKIEKEMKFNRR